MGVTEPFQPLATLLAAAKAHFTPQYVETTKQWERLPLGHELCDYRDAIKKATAGEEKEHAIVKMLDELGYERNVLQVQMHQHFINALAPQIYGIEFDRNLHQILARKKLDRFWSDVVMLTPRRMGKTYGTAMMAVVLLTLMEGFEIIVFSVSMDTSTKMLDLVRAMMPAHMWKYVREPCVCGRNPTPNVLPLASAGMSTRTR